MCFFCLLYLFLHCIMSSLLLHVCWVPCHILLLASCSSFIILHYAILVCFAMPISCHIAFGHSCCCHEPHVHCTHPYVTCYFHVVGASALAISLSSHAHVSSPLPSFFLHVFASDIIPSFINVHSFPDAISPCLNPLCQFSALLDLIGLESKFPLVWI